MTSLELLDQLQATLDALREALTPVPPPALKPTTSDELRLALVQGGRIELVPGQTYQGCFTLGPNTELVGQGATIAGAPGAPALDIPPGVHDVWVDGLTLTSAYDQRVVCIGRNDASQATLELVPQKITFYGCTIPTYRGKRGFEVNGANVTIDTCTVKDLYNPSGTDSQCIWIGNTPGPVSVTNCLLEGGTETLMVGGDTMKIPGVVPTGLLIQDCHLSHPLAWFTDTTKHFVKNILELKTGHDVTVRRCTLDGSWRDAQSGYAFMITPRNGGDINGVLVEDVVISNVASAFAFMGRTDVAPATPSPTQNVVVRRVNATTSKTYCAGLGTFALLIGEVHDVSFDSITFVGDGNYFLSTSASNVWDLTTNAVRTSGPMESLSITNSTFTAGIYGLFLNGYANAAPAQQGVKTLTVTGNTITGANAALVKNLPQNTYQ